MSFKTGRDDLRRAQAIAADVNEDMPDADLEENFAEMRRRIYDPTYIPRNRCEP